MYKNSNTFYPSKVYLNIDFEEIKKKLKDINNINIKDYGRIIFVKISDFMVSVNNLGEIDFYYDSINELELKNNVKNIENIFKQQIKEFDIIM
jgi:hypothetical protein